MVFEEDKAYRIKEEHIQNILKVVSHDSNGQKYSTYLDIYFNYRMIDSIRKDHYFAEYIGDSVSMSPQGCPLFFHYPPVIFEPYLTEDERFLEGF